ncbi:gliding motility protein GldL [Marinilabiliaceae bacterium ANBcel2]|nr:gliding motility protein GldL [Marinilabiliaceae bacterium ANBcel2]
MSGSSFFESPAYKKIMAKVYGIGASVVILGALWKILHLPGADLMLIAGLGTESIIFFLSAFEPPHEMPDWSLVYPELVGLEPRERPVNVQGLNMSGVAAGAATAGAVGAVTDGGKGSSGAQPQQPPQGAAPSGGGEISALVQSGHLDEETIKKLGEGLKKLTETADNLSSLSEASMATEAYLQTMKSASDSVGNLSTLQSKLEESAEALASSYSDTAKNVAETGSKFSENLGKTGDSFVERVKSSGEKLVSSYETLGETMGQQVSKVATDGDKYTENLAEANQKLSSINSAYELQLANISAQVKASEDLSQNIGEISQHMSESVNDTVNYKKGVADLSKTLGELNSIYGNMLSAMSMRGSNE